MAIVAGVSEAGAGALLVLGLLTPLASAAVIGTLVVAGSVHRTNDERTHLSQARYPRDDRAAVNVGPVAEISR